MKTVTLPAIECHQDGTRLIITKMRAGDLDDYTKVDPFVSAKDFSDPDQGYQRPVEQPRIKKLANWLRRETENGGKARMPTAILLSARGSEVIVSASGTITLKDTTKLPLVDGQHRKEGFKYAINEKGMPEFAEYEIPVVIMMDLDKLGEMHQFSVVNGTQKSVRTDLVNMILTQMAEQEGSESVRSAEHWKVVVSQVVKKLNADPTGPWFDRIVMPDQQAYSKTEHDAKPELRHRRIARATSFMSALKPIEAYLSEHFTDSDPLNTRADKLYAYITAFWSAVRDLSPDCFENADDYVMLKTPGIFALHRLCLRVMKDMYVGHRPWDLKNFKEMLESSKELSDPTYWAVGTNEGDRGDAAKYGSMKGFSELSDLLYEALRS